MMDIKVVTLKEFFPMKIKSILLFILFFFISLWMTLPANKVIGFIAKEANVDIGSISGTLWDGEVKKLSYKNRYQLQQLNWKVDWLALMSLKLQLDVKFNDGLTGISGKGLVALGFSGWSVENILVDISANELLTYFSLPMNATADGRISMVIHEGSQGTPYCNMLDGNIIWRNAMVHSELGTVNLETVNIKLNCVNGELVAIQKQTSNDLVLDSTLLLKENNRYKLQGKLKAGKSLNSEVKNVLSWLGPDNKTGDKVFNTEGQL